MVYIHFPTNYTEEELMLQAKYQKLKRKKKALLSLKTPKQDTDKVILKRPAEAKDAKEVAKKLIKSGIISAIPKPDNKQERTTFKRSTGFERKLNGTDKALTNYQPFSATHPEEESLMGHRKTKNLYDHFVTGSIQEVTPDTSEVKSPYKSRQGNTLYIYGYNITEEILKRSFQSFGKIINISMEIEKNCGFVTFERAESAEKAVLEMNGCMVSGIQLKVSFARRQPIIEPINDASSSSTWSTIAASHSQKGNYCDKRSLVTYDEEIF